MKDHFRILFDPLHRWRTVSFFLASLLLILAATMVGVTDNPPGIALLYAGMIFLFVAILHPWRKARNYAILAGTCAGIILGIFLGIYIYASLAIKPGETVEPTAWAGFLEGFFMLLILFVCVPGILIGITGSVYWSLKGNPARGLVADQDSEVPGENRSL